MTYSPLARLPRSRRLSLVLALSLVVSVLAFVAAPPAAAAGTYWDDDGNFHESAIEAITAAGIDSGCGGGAFCPADVMTRWMMAVWLIRALGEEGNMPSHQGYFTDVPSWEWWAPYVERLSELGVTLGVGNYMYDPYGSVSRAQMAVYLIRAFGDESAVGGGTNFFGDVLLSDSQSWWYRGHVELLYDMEITTGCSATPRLYCPFVDVPRDQMSSFVARAMGLIAVGGATTTTTDVWDPPSCPVGFCLAPSSSQGFGKTGISWCIATQSSRPSFNEWEIARNAFAVWARITIGGNPIFTFSNLICSQADIEIHWVSTLGTGVLGNATPDSYQSPTHVVINMNDAVTMTAQTELSTLIHEIGHALGLNHSLDPNCIMFPDSGGTAQQNGTTCQEERDTLGSLYGNVIGGGDVFYSNYVTATGANGATETLAWLTNDGTMPLPCAVDSYWTADRDMGWHCSWLDNGSAWGWQVERMDSAYEGLSRGISLSAVAIDTSAYDVTWASTEVLSGNTSKSFKFDTTDQGLVVPFVITYDPNGDDDYGWQLNLTRTVSAPFATYTWNATTVAGNSGSYVQIVFVRFEPKTGWTWAYSFGTIYGAGSGTSSPLVTNTVSANNWTNTTFFSVTLGYNPYGEDQWIWDTTMQPTTSGCPGTATRCVDVFLQGFDGSTSSYANVMTVVLGQ